MILVYTAGPYRSDTINGVVKNIQVAREHSERLWQAGYAVLCPHLNTALFNGLVDDQVFLDGTMEMLKRCDMIYLLPGWNSSSGTLAELAYARSVNMPVLYYTDRLEKSE